MWFLEGLLHEFSGQYSYKLDDKGRLTLPAIYRSELAPEKESTVFIVRDLDRCIAIYSAVEFKILRMSLMALDMSQKQNRAIARRQISSSFEVAIDSHSRIKIPAALLSFARIETKSTVVLTGFMNRVNIWNPEEYEISMKTFDEDDIQD
jgi:MraZ protein